MAKVKYTKAVVAAVNLELTEEEAVVLRSVLQCVAGTTEGPRGLVDRVEDALEKAGVGLGILPTGFVRFGEENNDEG